MTILVIGSFPQDIQQRIRQSFPENWTVNISGYEDAQKYLSDAEVIIPEHISITEAVLCKAPNLKMIQTGVGYDNIDIPACRKRDVIVCNSAGINSTAVAEHTLALILSWFKNIPYLDASLKNHQRPDSLSYKGGEVSGKTIGLIGFGTIGRKVASLCIAFGINVLVYCKHEHSFDGVRFVDLDTLLAESDIVSLHLPANEETYHLINGKTFSQMKDSALFVNTSRGRIVDEDELIRALENKSIAGACLDVFESEPLPDESKLRDFDNVILTPHTAGLPDGVKYHKARYDFFYENIQKLEKNETPLNII